MTIRLVSLQKLFSSSRIVGLQQTLDPPCLNRGINCTVDITLVFQNTLDLKKNNTVDRQIRPLNDSLAFVLNHFIFVCSYGKVKVTIFIDEIMHALHRVRYLTRAKSWSLVGVLSDDHYIFLLARNCC